jgi:hypothetical protein
VVNVRDDGNIADLIHSISKRLANQT